MTALHMQAVIFDFDGVLFDSEPAYLQVRYQFAKEKNPALQIEGLYESVGCTTEQAWMMIANQIGNGQTWKELVLEFTPIAEKAYSRFDFPSLLREDVPKTLEALTGEGLKLAVASANNTALVCYTLEQAGIRQYFDAILCGDQCKASKPSPEIYLRAADAINVPAKACLALEDSTIGIRAAHDAEMTVAALKEMRFSFDQTMADYEIDSVEEIINIIESRF